MNTTVMNKPAEAQFGFSKIMQMVAAAAKEYNRRANQRRAVNELQALPDAMLKDIGLPRSEINYAVKNGWPRGS